MKLTLGKERREEEPPPPLSLIRPETIGPLTAAAAVIKLGARFAVPRCQGCRMQTLTDQPFAFAVGEKQTKASLLFKIK